MIENFITGKSAVGTWVVLFVSNFLWIIETWSYKKTYEKKKKKKQNQFGNIGVFMICRMAQEIIFRFFPFSRSMILRGGGGGGGGVLASCEASANFFPGVVREIWLVPDLWAFHICNRRPPLNYSRKVINP